MPSVMAACWVGQNSGPIFAICEPKYSQLSAGVPVVCDTIFQLMLSYTFLEIFV